MATFTGENGQVKAGADGAEVAIAEVRSWTLEHTKDVIEDTVMGDASRTYKSGLHSFTGTMEVVYDSGHDALGSFDPSDDTDLFVEFYPSSAAGNKFQGQVIVTSVSRSASFDDMVTASVSFQGTGALSSAAV